MIKGTVKIFHGLRVESKSGIVLWWQFSTDSFASTDASRFSVGLRLYTFELFSLVACSTYHCAKEYIYIFFFAHFTTLQTLGLIVKTVAPAF